METAPNPNLTPAVTHQPSQLGGAEDTKLVYAEELDNRRESLARARAWEAIALDMAQLASRRAMNAASFDHAVSMGSVLAAQAGVTEGQAAVSPIRTGAADTQVQQPAGAVYPPIRNVDQSGATATAGTQAAQEQIAANIAALSDVVTKLSDALAAVLVTAAKPAAA